MAFHRYTFPESEFSRIILDLGYNIRGKGKKKDGVLNFVNDTTIEGYRNHHQDPGKYMIYVSSVLNITELFDTGYIHRIGQWILLR
ncbi:MAG: hypothetical protein R2757_18080 [Draconibacterium sp.]